MCINMRELGLRKVKTYGISRIRHYTFVSKKIETIYICTRYEDAKKIIERLNYLNTLNFVEYKMTEQYLIVEARFDY